MPEHDDDHRYITREIFDDNHDAAKTHFVADRNDPFAVMITCEKNFLSLSSLILLNHYASPVNAPDLINDLRSNAEGAHTPAKALTGSVNGKFFRDAMRLQHAPLSGDHRRQRKLCDTTCASFVCYLV